MPRGGSRGAPAVLKAVKGNPGKRPIPDVPRLDPQAPNEPDWVEILPGGDDGLVEVRADASTMWRTVVPQLDGHGLLALADVGALIEACVVWARILECERALSREGLMLEVKKRGRDGTTWTEWERNPLSVTVKEYRIAWARSVDQLGLAPASRNKLGAGRPPGDGEDPWA